VEVSDFHFYYFCIYTLNASQYPNLPYQVLDDRPIDFIFEMVQLEAQLSTGDEKSNATLKKYKSTLSGNIRDHKHIDYKLLQLAIGHERNPFFRYGHCSLPVRKNGDISLCQRESTTVLDPGPQVVDFLFL